MKFILVISLCSFVNNQCLPPVEIKTHYNSWKDCAVAALIISKNLLEIQPVKDVNTAQLATQYSCTEQEII
tara:strand:+ start:258 stop:470 length:213 start_codon:yes stop_codon:yes gene_type:complete